jgi:hypothetical protein
LLRIGIWPFAIKTIKKNESKKVQVLAHKAAFLALFSKLINPISPSSNSLALSAKAFYSKLKNYYDIKLGIKTIN